MQNTEIKLIDDTHNGVIRVTVDGENAYTPMHYEANDRERREYLKIAKQYCFDVACKASLTGSVIISEVQF